MLSKEFVFAGSAVFTVEATNAWPQSDDDATNRYTFRIGTPAAGKEEGPWFIGLLAGPDNTSDYVYLGTVFDAKKGEVKLTKKSRMTENSTPVRVVRWFLRHVVRNRELPEGFNAYHEGRCGRCGRALTVPESIKSGLGPICAGRIE